MHFTIRRKFKSIVCMIIKSVYTHTQTQMQICFIDFLLLVAKNLDFFLRFFKNLYLSLLLFIFQMKKLVKKKSEKKKEECINCQ